MRIMALFEKDSIENITSLEHLDKALTVVSIKGWLFLLFSLLLSVGVVIWSFMGTIPIDVSGKGIVFDPVNSFVISSKATGTVKKIYALGGDLVKEGEVLMVIEDSSQKESSIYAYQDGVINWVRVFEGDQVSINQPLISLQGTPLPENMEIYGFFPLNVGQSIKPGMKAKCALSIVNTSKYGMLKGTVQEVLPYPESLHGYRMQKIPSESLREYLVRGDLPSLLVVVKPDLDPQTVSGFSWTSVKGPALKIQSGNIGIVNVTLEDVSPISYVIPQIRKD